jgi:hypothetical protein
MTVIATVTTTNTGAATIDLGPGAATIVKRNAAVVLANGDIAASSRIILMYDGTNFVLLNPVTQ